jgi:hypothetical protein
MEKSQNQNQDAETLRSDIEAVRSCPVPTGRRLANPVSSDRDSNLLQTTIV